MHSLAGQHIWTYISSLCVEKLRVALGASPKMASLFEKAYSSDVEAEGSINQNDILPTSQQAGKNFIRIWKEKYPTLNVTRMPLDAD